ncbi:MAG: hypothetical protein ACTH30_13750 [Leucobacter sp.]
MSATSSTAPRYGFQFRKVNHLVRYSVDARTGDIHSEIQPCDSATCARAVCQRRAVQKRIQALRYVLRKRGARLLTLTKFEDPKTADRFAELMKHHLRRAGYGAEFYMAIEPHSRGLLHAHIYLVSEASDQQIDDLFRVHITPELKLTEWSNLDISPERGPQSASYLLKEAEGFSLARHLVLNGGRLSRKHTPGFFHWAAVSGVGNSTKAERRRARLFRIIEEAKGYEGASRVSAQVPEVHKLAALAALLLWQITEPQRLAYLELIEATVADYRRARERQTDEGGNRSADGSGGAFRGPP